MRAGSEPPQRLGRPEGMEQLGSLALILFIGTVGCHAGDPLEQRLIRVSVSVPSCCRNRCRRFIDPPFALVVFLDDIGEDEAIAVTRDGTKEPGLPRLVAEHSPDRPHRLTQRTVGHDDISPDSIEDVPAMDGFAAPLDQKDEQIEVAGDERLLASVAKQHAASRGDDELAETIPGHRGQDHSSRGFRLEAQVKYSTSFAKRSACTSWLDFAGHSLCLFCVPFGLPGAPGSLRSNQ
jgi:hypothetical protein